MPARRVRSARSGRVRNAARTNLDRLSGLGQTAARWSKAELAQLDQQIVEAFEKSRPQSVRHIFYVMTDSRLPCPVEKSENGYKTVG